MKIEINVIIERNVTIDPRFVCKNRTISNIVEKQFYKKWLIKRNKNDVIITNDIRLKNVVSVFVNFFLKSY